MKALKPTLMPVLFFITCTTFAQSAGSRKRQHQSTPSVSISKQVRQTIDRLAIKIALSDQQKNHLQQLHIRFAGQMIGKVIADHTPDEEGWQLLMDNFDKDLKLILSENQLKMYGLLLNQTWIELSESEWEQCQYCNMINN